MTIVATAMVGIAASRAVYAAARGKPFSDDTDVPSPTPSWQLAFGTAVDSVITAPVGLLASTGSDEQYDLASAELDAAAAATGGDDLFVVPPALTDAAVHIAPAGGHGSVLRFDSGWAPASGAPGRERWLGFAANRTVRVLLLEHAGPPRPWLVMLHGQGMGRGGDERMLKARWIHDTLGVNVALPVLPLHGPRSEGFAAHEQFVSNLYLQNNVFGLAQAVWDVRRLIGWLRASRSAPQVGVLGVSLGSMVCSLLATTDADLACAIPVVPTVDLAGALRRSEPAIGSRARLHRQLHDERADTVLRSISPIERKCLVPHERRLIVAGQVDHIAAPADAAALWRAWDKPRIEWMPGGHLTTFTSRRYRDLIGGFLRDPGA